MKMKMELANVEQSAAPETEWCELTEDLKKEVLARLPLESLCKFRSVCKQWNVLLSSTKFITGRWAEAPLNSKPWLIVCNEHVIPPICLSYCFVTQTWKIPRCISLSFLTADNAINMSRSGLSYHGSAAGLILADIPARHTIVCNPLTRKFVHLPPTRYITDVMARGITVDEYSPESYKVVTVGVSGTVKIVEIYDSFHKSWSFGGKLPWGLVINNRSGGIVFCDGFFYCMTQIPVGVMAFSMRDGASILEPLPLPNNENKNTVIKWPHLLTCGSRVLVAGGTAVGGGHRLDGVIIWEYQYHKTGSDSSPWKEIARMPESMFSILFDQRRLWIESVGVGNYVCLKAFPRNGCGSFEVVVYNLNSSPETEESWSWLPKWPIATAEHLEGTAFQLEGTAFQLKGMAFQPRPDMKVL